MGYPAFAIKHHCKRKSPAGVSEFANQIKPASISDEQRVAYMHVTCKFHYFSYIINGDTYKFDS